MYLTVKFSLANCVEFAPLLTSCLVFQPGQMNKTIATKALESDTYSSYSDMLCNFLLDPKLRETRDLLTYLKVHKGTPVTLVTPIVNQQNICHTLLITDLKRKLSWSFEPGSCFKPINSLKTAVQHKLTLGMAGIQDAEIFAQYVHSCFLYQYSHLSGYDQDYITNHRLFENVFRVFYGLVTQTLHHRKLCFVYILHLLITNMRNFPSNDLEANIEHIIIKLRNKYGNYLLSEFCCQIFRTYGLSYVEKKNSLEEKNVVIFPFDALATNSSRILKTPSIRPIYEPDVIKSDALLCDFQNNLTMIHEIPNVISVTNIEESVVLDAQVENDIVDNSIQPASESNMDNNATVSYETLMGHLERYYEQIEIADINKHHCQIIFSYEKHNYIEFVQSIFPTHAKGKRQPYLCHFEKDILAKSSSNTFGIHYTNWIKDNLRLPLNCIKAVVKNRLKLIRAKYGKFTIETENGVVKINYSKEAPLRVLFDVNTQLSFMKQFIDQRVVVSDDSLQITRDQKLCSKIIKSFKLGSCSKIPVIWNFNLELIDWFIRNMDQNSNNVEEDNADAVEDNTNAVEDGPDAVETNTNAVETNTNAVDDSPDVAETNTNAVDDSPDVAENATLNSIYKELISSGSEADEQNCTALEFSKTGVSNTPKPVFIVDKRKRTKRHIPSIKSRSKIVKLVLPNKNQFKL